MGEDGEKRREGGKEGGGGDMNCYYTQVCY